MFKKARLKLTAWYLVIIMVISISFSFALYGILQTEIHRFAILQRGRFERRYSPSPLGFSPAIDADLVEGLNRRLIFSLIVINTGIFIVSAGLGYFLAGRTLRPIKKMLEDQNRFISDASHELKTPITALKTSLEVGLRDKNLTLAKAKELVAENLSDVNRLQKLTESLLSISNFQSNANLSNLTNLSLDEILETAKKQTSSLARIKKIKVKLEKTDQKIFGDKNSLAELFVVLLDNAIKYNRKGGNVDITFKNTANMAVAEISDSGIGISKEDLPHIFDRFYRADSARSQENHNGFGLGLSIAKQIVDNHHGKIVAESEIGKGSIFSVYLPT
ncbi:HAMP domain-containing histidine kinase [Candidatus Parcubacteria bacterium]|nr:HAMP domain-containing histidine kinase [Patescibacteria group bacterium]MBU4380858.1 HAMP domain-containing histidine kinase [Patescibacteria group bacterium]MCG2688909.1 HAMP domain-containing histidine kinase [Candidatus Parcubacteria bacterium]